jgi:hypothetical protein
VLFEGDKVNLDRAGTVPSFVSATW